MTKITNLAELLYHKPRYYLHTDTLSVSDIKSEPKMMCNVNNLFFVTHSVGVESQGYLIGLTNFITQFNEQCTFPIELDMCQVCQLWPADPLEAWISDTHSKFVLHSRLHHDIQKYTFNIKITVSGVVDIDHYEYVSQFNQAAVMKKLATSQSVSK